VLEFLDSDLEALIKAKGVVLAPADVKAYMLMLLRALQDCHQHWVLHRDIKPNNMLISRDGEIRATRRWRSQPALGALKRAGCGAPGNSSRQPF
jgi:serine/threonine protein kinase